MIPGAVDVDSVSRRFVVRARETHTLKELLVARGRTGAQEVWALRDVSLAIAPGEAVALALRELLFEDGRDVADPAVLDEIAARFGVTVEPEDAETVAADRREGAARGVVGSPHFFTPEGSFFCPSLDIHRDDDGGLHVDFDRAGFEQFVDACFG